MPTAARFNAKKPARLLRVHDVHWGVPGRGHSGDAFRIAGELEELQAEREAAQEAAKAALRRLGWR